MKDYQSRLDKIEKEFGPAHVFLLTFADGSTKEVGPPPGKDVLSWLVQLMNDTGLSDAVLIRSAVAYSDPGGGHMLDLIKSAPAPETQRAWNAGYEAEIARRRAEEQQAQPADEFPPTNGVMQSAQLESDSCEVFDSEKSSDPILQNR
jgi:hypothetical protein